MIKNTTRKGLALLSTAALSFAGLVGFAAPAQANSLVTLAPKVGTEYAVPLDAAFTLQTRSAASDNPYGDPMYVEVVDTDGQLLSVDFNGAATYDATTKTWEAETAQASGATKDIVLTPKTTATATFSVKVKTGFDGAATSPERTVTFHKAADYTWNLSFTTPLVGDAKFAAQVSTTPQLNLAQIASSLKVGFATVASNSVLTAATATTTVSSDTTRLSGGTAASVTTDVKRQTDGSYKWSVAVVDAAAPANTVKSANTYAAQIVYGTAEVGTRQVIKPAADSITKLTTPELAASVNTKDDLIRVGATSVDVETTAYTAYTSETVNTVTPAGQTVKVTITKGSQFDAKATVSAGGKTLTATTVDNKIEITATVGDKGAVSVPLALVGLKAGDKFSVAVAAQNADGVAGAALTDEFTVTATAAGQLVDHNILGGSAAWKVAHGTYTIRFAVLDNFDQPLVGTGYRVVLDNGTAADITAQPLVNGVATFSVSTKNSADGNVSSFSAQLQKASGLTFSDEGVAVTRAVVIGASSAAATLTVIDGTTTAASANEFTLPATGTFALALKDLKSANTRLGEAAPTLGVLGATLDGAIVDANGVGTYGDVTISAPGLMFAADAPTAGTVTKTVYSMDSITVQTNSTGSYAGVKVYSNKAGKVAVTVTSGAASRVVTLTFAAAAVGTGTTLVVDAPASVVPGSTLVVKATLADKYGNPVSAGTAEKVVVSYNGPGLPLTTPDKFTNGALQFGVLLGSNDSGTATVTVSVYEGTGTVVPAKITVQKSIVIGTAGNAGDYSSWTKKLDDNSAKIYAKNVVGAGKVQFFLNGEEIAWVRATSATDAKLRSANGANYLVRTVEFAAGKNVLEVFVDGVRTTRTAYTK